MAKAKLKLRKKAGKKDISVETDVEFPNKHAYTGTLMPGQKNAETPFYYWGIDPGQTGAIAVVNQNAKFVHLADYGEPELFATELADMASSYWPELCVLEKVSAMPKQGVSSTFKFGTNFGIWLGFLNMLGIPHRLVTPATWHKVLDSAAKRKKGENPRNAKKRLLNAARREFPDAPLKLERHHGRAEAIYMAIYARLLYHDSRR